MVISFQDVERLQALYPDNQIELREGKIVIMSPSDDKSSMVIMRLGRLLDTWVDNNNLGYILESSAGFRLPNGDLLSPDLSFVSRERLKHPLGGYLPVVPELIVEVRSSTDRISTLREKIVLFLSQGIQVGILVDPKKRTVTIYRPGEKDKSAEDAEFILQETVLRDGDILTIPELFPGLEIPISRIWPRVYE